ncbi:ankyrin repeat-containing domain protein [Chaetomidium leptoderma]|uniref:Ankyrin repeat-containing domain protein n=1 Tax=Chaetomidium leptoderma TaxID=669021 RepID=A0AAN6ZYT2_9PEZI|nr:ankyrin repeat-containing domain protein [Chaetomidium leptoderma]
MFLLLFALAIVRSQQQRVRARLAQLPTQPATCTYNPEQVLHPTDVDLEDDKNRTLLSHAAGEGHEAVVQMLLLSTSKPEVNKKDKAGRAPLSHAAGAWDKAVVLALLATGQVDVNAQDKSGRTPLDHAVSVGNTTTMHLLRESGAQR